jgi:hypothetical protein
MAGASPTLVKLDDEIEQLLGGSSRGGCSISRGLHGILESRAESGPVVRASNGVAFGENGSDDQRRSE